MNTIDLNCLPPAFLQRVDELLSTDERAQWEASLRSRPLSVRWTGPSEDVASGRDYLVEHGLSPQVVPWCSDAWSFAAGSHALLTSLPWVERQTLFMQSLSSIAAVEAMGIEPGHDVLDVCAAPGAKTSLIRRRQGDRGILIANELSRVRSRRMHSLLKRLGVANVEVITRPGEQLGSSHERCFDRVLVDVPCSGEGRIHPSNPASWSRWSESAIRGLARRQESLLESACRAARPGGVILYATCTMAPEENEGVIDRVLRRARTPIELVDIGLPLVESRPGMTEWRGTTFAKDVGRAVRIIGSDTMTPFFMARIQRVD